MRDVEEEQQSRQSFLSETECGYSEVHLQL